MPLSEIFLMVSEFIPCACVPAAKSLVITEVSCTWSLSGILFIFNKWQGKLKQCCCHLLRLPSRSFTAVKTLVVICNLKMGYFWFRRVHGSSSTKVPYSSKSEIAVRCGEIWDPPRLVTRSISETQERAHVWDGLRTDIGKGEELVAVWLLETGEKPQGPYLHPAEDKLGILSSLVAPASLTWHLLKR